ncbi:cbb3-type cytochrome c oxidase N-terminal domain-containing protein [Marinigracilibium pacificum]|uniref:C-type cytochrome n=1 Tax=Marinigracilibium pacificum TaxID=2729599 RepID=A0A848J768_9BACT|nr:cbb3-type cytochrome c oxidase N-terminal domain-containing protein [Marinigracilibium pacificum]NMM50239.1 c-type cytochrome [Marinigracilibium pacificum]
MKYINHISLKGILAPALAFISAGNISAQDKGLYETINSLSETEIIIGLLTLGLLMVALLVLVAAVYTLSVIRMIVREKKIKEGATAEELSETTWSSWLTDINNAVPIEQEESIELDHDYDGIKELDNHLPPWWKALFYICIVWGVIYMMVYHVFDAAPLQAEEYEIAMAEAKEEAAKFANVVDESNLAFSEDPAQLESGKLVFEANCAVCHRNDMGGQVGPNLTDKYWLHGGSPTDIYMTIKNGVPEKGMISWEAQLTKVQIRNVTSYIHSMYGSEPANPKEPQGEEFTYEEN